ncbi:hypothetical protein GPUN_0791 [Glaciecola punicea ACAM 611]|uniref:Uncharacterized protein n=1 Tax=Glaciecola punicea ACAM 611 TaxID=1121923 RepID=H5T9E9_9ALTE|nr:hypothetical protein GPUN_0791 [Glaciecola punicea ACAM 611]
MPYISTHNSVLRSKPTLRLSSSYISGTFEIAQAKASALTFVCS